MEKKKNVRKIRFRFKKWIVWNVFKTFISCENHAFLLKFRKKLLNFKGIVVKTLAMVLTMFMTKKIAKWKW